MALQSQLFKGDPQLEAAAVSDPAHISPGASGPHVRKIQLALIALDGANIVADGKYGPATAAAVLAYKRKRNIINRSYQTQADNIVGKMTMAALDQEMVQKERVLSGPARLEAIAPKRRLSQFGAAPSNVRQVAAMNSALTNQPNTLPTFDTAAIDLKLFGIGSFKVLNGFGGTVNCDPNIAILSDPRQPLSAGTSLPVTQDDPQVFNVRGVNPGVGMITFQRLLFAPLLTLPIALIVRAPTKVQRVFVKGIEHNHKPSGKWPEVSKSPRNAVGGVNDSGLIDSGVMTVICKGCSNPKCVVDKIVSLGFDRFPVARSHIDWYLKSGGGRDFDEDGNIGIWLRNDGGIRMALRSELSGIADKTGKKTGHFEFEQINYKDDDFKNSFGGIDRVDYEFDFTQDECSVWFQDRYEWHPVYEGLYDVQDGDITRPTNCAHAAFVELKTQGAADFWMKGQATVPLSVILSR